MKFTHTLAVMFIAAVIVFLNANPSRCEPNADNKQAGQSIIGSWRADSVSMLIKDGEKMKYPKWFDKRSFNVTITKKAVTLWEDGKIFAEMKFDAASQLTAGTIDGEYQDEGVLGIYELAGDKLKISLNNENKGRPENYDADANYCVLNLQRFQGAPLLVINADGSELRQFVALPEFTECNSPAWSPDGTKVAFDCWRSLFGETPDASHVFTVNADGGSPKDLGDGALPSWSPDGKQIVYSRYNPSRGIWIMNADGTNSQLIDADGWGAEWSPKKDELVYIIPNGSGENLCVQNLKTQERRNLLEKEYVQVFWSMAWSPDADWICFMGRLPAGGFEIALVHAEGQAKGFKVLLPNSELHGVKSFENYPAWSPDGKQILLPMAMEGDANLQQYLLDPDGKTPPKKLPGLDPSRKYFDSSWSRDGKKILLSSWPGVEVKKKDK